MKHVPLLAIAVFYASVAFAQTSTPAVVSQADTLQKSAKRIHLQELETDIRSYKKQKAEAKMAMIKGDFTSSKALFATAKISKQHIKAKIDTLKSEGVPHPLKLANKGIKIADQRIILTDVKKLLVDKASEKAARKASNPVAIDTAKAIVRADKKILRKDIKEAERDAAKPAVFFVKVKAHSNSHT